jgi:hypothetical protein
MTEHHDTRILLPDDIPVDSLDASLARGGGEAFAIAQQLPDWTYAPA